jgi:hypothetical protein
MNESMNEWVNNWMTDLMNERLIEIKEWMYKKLTNKLMHEWMN